MIKSNITDKSLHYQAEADNKYHIYLKKEQYVLEIPHYHESLEFVYMIKSENQTANIAGQSYKLNDGDICFVNKMQVHNYPYTGNNLTAIVLVISKEYTRNFFDFYSQKVFPTIMNDKQKNEEAIKILTEWVSLENRTRLIDCAYTNLFLNAILSHYDLINEIKSTSNERATEFIDYVENNYSKPISLNSMAKALNYSIGHCSRLFNSYVGMSFKEYLNLIRMKKATELLNEKELSTSQIMEKCGYDSHATFYRQLKKYKESMHP